MIEEFLDHAHRGQIHSIAIVGCGEAQLHTAAYGHDIMLCGSLDALKHSILDEAMEPL